MNWLAHLHLAIPRPHARVGGLLPDLLQNRELDALPTAFAPFIVEHQLIDSFTDSHPTFRRSRERISDKFRRFAGILIDVYYDHILSTEWQMFSEVSIQTLLAEFYRDIETLADEIPGQAYERLVQIRDAGWLGSYGELDGVEGALARISARFSRPVDLTPALVEMAHVHEALRADFLEYYPQLIAHVGKSRATINQSELPV